MRSTSKQLNIIMTIIRGQLTRCIPSIWWASSNTSKRVQYLWSQFLSAAQALQWCSNFHSTSPLLSISLGEILDQWLFSESQAAQVSVSHWITLSMMEQEKSNSQELSSMSLAWFLMKSMSLLLVATLPMEFVSMESVKLLMKSWPFYPFHFTSCMVIWQKFRTNLVITRLPSKQQKLSALNSLRRMT